jgi:hypothetical protein
MSQLVLVAEPGSKRGNVDVENNQVEILCIISIFYQSDYIQHNPFQRFCTG